MQNKCLETISFPDSLSSINDTQSTVLLPSVYSSNHKNISCDQGKPIDTSHYYLTPEQMKRAIRAMSIKALEKNYEFRCTSCARDELFTVVASIFKNPALQHQQIIYLSNKQHWSVLDISCVDGRVNFILYDASNSLCYVIPTLMELRHNYPFAAITYLGANFQKEGYSCAYFSLDGAYNLAKIKNLPQLLEQYPSEAPDSWLAQLNTFYDNEQEKWWISEYKKEQLNQVLMDITRYSISNWPKELGSLVKMIQYKEYFDLFFSKQGYTCHNKKSLDEHVNIFFKFDWRTGNWISDAINIKKEKIDDITIQHFGTANNFFASSESPRNETAPTELTRAKSTL